jgi:hypothetical protein
MSDFNVNLYYGRSFDQCIACSEFVLDQYLTRREQFLLEVINNPKYIHEVTHLKELLEDSHHQVIELDDDDVIYVS